MRRIFEQRVNWMMVVVATLLFSLGWGRNEMAPALAETVPAATGTGGLITYFEENSASGNTRVIMIDPQLRRMAVYDVPQGNGAIQLRSVRNLTVDLQLQSFNSEDPSPIDMEKMLQRK